MVENKQEIFMNGICIYGASSQNIAAEYKKAAYETGFLIGKGGYTLVFGAGGHGAMGEAARGAHDAGGKITGVIPERLNLPGIPSEYCTELIVTPTMHIRKQTMENLSVGFITLAGGFGTFEELLEVLTLKQLGYIDAPIVILNTNNYYTDLIRMINRCVDEKFADKRYLELFYVADTPQSAMDYILSYRPKAMPDKVDSMLKDSDLK